MNRITKLLLALVACALCAAPAAAQEGTLKKIKDTGVIKIGNRDASLPLSYLDDQQKPIGYGTDICLRVVDAIKAELTLTVHYTVSGSAVAGSDYTAPSGTIVIPTGASSMPLPVHSWTTPRWKQTKP